MKLLLTRHWETYDNLEWLLTGQKDVDLTEKWKEEARLLSKKLEKHEINVVYCSTLKRAKETIAPYLEHRNMTIIYTDDLKEMDLWKYNWAPEIDENMKIERSKWMHHKVGWGESLYDLFNRASSFLEKIKNEHKNETILLVWHNAINRNIIGIIKWYSIQEINEKKERYPNAEVLEFEVF